MCLFPLMLSGVSCLSPGYDLSTMAAEVYDDAIVDVVSPDTLIADTVQVKVSPVSYLPVSQRSHRPRIFQSALWLRSLSTSLPHSH